MNIHKVINNNVLSAYDGQGMEVVIMGRGIGFQAKAGEPIEESRIEKVFRIENKTLSTRFQKMISNMPLEHMEISADIIAYAKTELNLKLSQSIYIALTDHINYAIERFRQNIELTNALLWEIRQFYPQEYLAGEYAVRLMDQRLGIRFSENEAGFIALHFVNAEYDTTIRDTYAATNLLHKALEIVRREFQMDFNESSLHYQRFITHLKFFAKRLYKKELLKDTDPEFAEMIRRKYPREHICGMKIANYIEREYGTEVSAEEIMYLTIHIRRILLKED